MMNVDRFGEWAFEEVPLDALKLSWPRLASIQAEVKHLIGEHAEAAREVTALEATREGAREQDLDAAAAALRAGNAVPSPKASPALQRKIESAVRTRDALERAVSSAIGDSNAFRLKHSASLLADATWSLSALRSKLAENAKKTAALYAESEAAAASVKKLEPPAAAPPQSSAAGQDTVYAPQFVATTSRSAGPERGDIERVLSHLAALG
jgi:hypothetical protein